MQPTEKSLCARAQAGDEAALAALITRMMPLIRKGAAACRAPGLEFDDAVQEGLIGLFNAVRGYDPAQGARFSAYAAACILHAQRDAHRRALRKKHAPLNFSVPLPELSAAPGPEERAIADEEVAAVLLNIRTRLSVLERRVLLASLDGAAPRQIALAPGSTPKAVQNALARARRKLRSAP